MERAGVKIAGRPFLMLLCAPILQIHLHWKRWLPNFLSGLLPHGQKGFVCVVKRERWSFLFMQKKCPPKIL